MTNQRGKTSFLQARSARLNPEAMKRALSDMVEEGILTSDHAWKGLYEKASGLPTVDPSEKPLCKGTGVSGGAITGAVALSIEKALQYTDKGQNAILVLEYTPGREMQDRYPQEIGVLTAHGGTARSSGFDTELVDGRLIDSSDDLLCGVSSLFYASEQGAIQPARARSPWPQAFPSTPPGIFGQSCGWPTTHPRPVPASPGSLPLW